MRSAVYVACFAMVLCVLLNVTASGETEITHIYTYDQPWYLKSESSVQDFHELGWIPEKGMEEKDPYQDFAGPALTSGNQMIQREISWRLDDGQIGNIDWKKVRNQFWAKFKIRIGETIEVSVPAVAPVECYSVCGSGYAAYSREVYEIKQQGYTAEVSILRPIGGIAVVYEDCMCLSHFDFCIGRPQPKSNQGTCASTTNQPFPNNNCTEVGTGSKWDLAKEPSLTGDDSTVPSTWGIIKELYRSE